MLHETSVVLVPTGAKKGGLYLLDLPNGGKSRRASASLVRTVSLVADAKPKMNTMDMWHQRFGHIGEAALRRTSVERAVVGMSIKKGDRLSFCEPYALGKSAREKFPKEGKHSVQMKFSS